MLVKSSSYSNDSKSTEILDIVSLTESSSTITAKLFTRLLESNLDVP